MSPRLRNEVATTMTFPPKPRVALPPNSTIPENMESRGSTSNERIRVRESIKTSVAEACSMHIHSCVYHVLHFEGCGNNRAQSLSYLLCPYCTRSHTSGDGLRSRVRRRGEAHGAKASSSLGRQGSWSRQPGDIPRSSKAAAFGPLRFKRRLHQTRQAHIPRQWVRPHVQPRERPRPAACIMQRDLKDAVTTASGVCTLQYPPDNISG